MAEPQAAGLRGHRRGQEIAGILLLAFAGFSLVSLHSAGAGVVGRAAADLYRQAAGRLADLIPLLFALWGLACLMGASGRVQVVRGGGLVLLFLTAVGGYHLFQRHTQVPPGWGLAEELHLYGRVEEAGGYLGALLFTGLWRPFGLLGSSIVLSTAALVAAVLVFDTPLLSLAGHAGGRAAGGAGQVGALLARGIRRSLIEGREGFLRLRDRLRLRRFRRAGRGARGARRDGDRAPGAAGRGGREDSPVPALPAPRQRGARPEQPAASARQEAAAALGHERDTEGADEGAGTRPGPQDRAGLNGRRQGRAFLLPTPSLISRPRERRQPADEEDQTGLLEQTLRNFGIEAKVIRVSRGPVITRYELQIAPGIKVSRVVSLADDLALSLAAQDVRIEAPIPGKGAIGIEVPNKQSQTVYFREVVESEAFRRHASPLAVGLGVDLAGSPVVADLQRLIHTLIAGATGSGKSVCLNTLIASLLFRAGPEQVRLLLVDPKRVELSNYDGIPHLLAPVVTDPKEAAGALRWMVRQMEARYRRFAEAGVRNLERYNEQLVATGEGEPLPYVVVIIDELADLMLVAAAEVEDSICRLAQMARAAGIHLVLATQRPSVDVITGLIKANVPSRIAFAVSSQTDSRVILDMPGAERLLGRGDMLFFPSGAAKPQRLQGALIFDRDVERLTAFWREQGEPEYERESFAGEGGGEVGDDMWDDLLPEAARLVTETRQASISMIQRRFRVGYSRAARLIDLMERRGIVGAFQGSKPREVLVSPDEAARRLAAEKREEIHTA